VVSGILIENAGRVNQSGDATRLRAKRFYHPELDVLRFFAFALVFSAHAAHPAESLINRGMPPVLVSVVEAFSSVGGFGVDIFFVLSAYLITELLLREKAQFGDLDVRSFYLRRILRIWPLYFAFLFSAAAASRWLRGTPDSWQVVLAYSALCGNWWTIFRDWPSLALSPLWTVSVEEQFYLAWPPVVRRLNKRQMLIACGFMVGAAMLTQLYLVHRHVEVEHIWCNSFARLEAIAGGIAVAVLLDGRSPKLAVWMRLMLFSVGFSALLFSAGYLHTIDNPVSISSIMVGYALIDAGSIAMLIAILAETPPWFARGPLVYLGRISYGLYVFHFLGLIVADNLMNHFLRTQAVRGGLPLAFLLTVIFAALSYHFYESRFLRIKERFARIPSRPVD
jgi:peptidoglycan/LPS O-acetylase OafA/YrhL